MSNTLIAWAAFYPVLSAAFGARSGGARKSCARLDFPWSDAMKPAARQTNPGIYASLRCASSSISVCNVLI
jgi:hypothetical protein